jgi:hypothetical protein
MGRMSCWYSSRPFLTDRPLPLLRKARCVRCPWAYHAMPSMWGMETSHSWTERTETISHKRIKLTSESCNHVKWIPYYNGMARPQVVDGGGGLKIWRIAANILNRQSRTDDRGWSSSLGVGREANNPHRKTTNVLRNVLKRPEPGRILWQNDHLKDQGADGWMGSKWTLETLVGGCGVDSPGSG